MEKLGTPWKTHAIFCTWDPLGEERQKDQPLLPSLSFTIVLQKVSLQKILLWFHGRFVGSIRVPIRIFFFHWNTPTR
jgi:hypothetical protein